MLEGDDIDIAATPANRHLGFRVVSRTAEAAVVAMEPRPDFLQAGGVVHGGVLSALADSAAVLALHVHGESPAALTSIDFKMSFLRPVRLEGGGVEARAGVVRRGRRVGVCEVAVTQAGMLAAQGLFTYWLGASAVQRQRERPRE